MPSARVDTLWICPRCHRTFRRAHQRHRCGVGNRDEVLAGRPAALVALYRTLERTVRGWRGVEIVARDRYALFRTSRIFADLVFMKDALRIAIHLPRRVNDPMFFKIGPGSARQISHVTRVMTARELRAAIAYMKEAYAMAEGERRA